MHQSIDWDHCMPKLEVRGHARTDSALGMIDDKVNRYASVDSSNGKKDILASLDSKQY